jgi:hypothetical protein
MTYWGHVTLVLAIVAWVIGVEYRLWAMLRCISNLTAAGFTQQGQIKDLDQRLQLVGLAIRRN